MFRNAKLRSVFVVVIAALLVPLVVWAVNETVTRDANQTPCPSISTAASECRNFRYNNTTTALLVSLAGTESGATVTMTQGGQQTTLSPWLMAPVPDSGGTGPFIVSNSAGNSAATATRAGVGGQRIYLNGVCAGYRGGNSTTSTRLTLTDGTASFNIPTGQYSGVAANGPGIQCAAFPTPIAFASGATLTATLDASGTGGVTGELVVYGFQR